MNHYPSQISRFVTILSDYALGDPFDNLTNNFAKPGFLKSRITMLYKNKNSNWTLGKYLAVLPLVGLVVLLTAARERDAEVIDGTPRLTHNTETRAAGFEDLRDVRITKPNQIPRGFDKSVAMYDTLPDQAVSDVNEKAMEDRLSKEKPQGKATEFQNYRMPDFDFKNATDRGLPTHSPNEGTFQNGSTNMNLSLRLTSPGHIEREQFMIIPIDTVPPATFMNYSLHKMNSGTAPGTFRNYSLPVVNDEPLPATFRNYSPPKRFYPKN